MLDVNWYLYTDGSDDKLYIKAYWAWFNPPGGKHSKSIGCGSQQEAVIQSGPDCVTDVDPDGTVNGTIPYPSWDPANPKISQEV